MFRAHGNKITARGASEFEDKEISDKLKILVIPDVHMKPWMFDRAAEIIRSGAAERAVCLMDLPDDWNQELNLDLYIETFDHAIRFQKEFLDTLWCYGNHELSYLWFQDESGFSPFAIATVNECLKRLRNSLLVESQLAYIHRIDNVLFLHGGLTHDFVKYYASDIDYRDTDGILRRINSLGRNEMWNDESPIWFRPQFSEDKLYRPSILLQVVGHTPMTGIECSGSVISCDVFSTYSTGEPIGSCEFLVIDTETRKYRKIK